MRTTLDRIRHAIGFEVIGLLGAMPLLALLFGVDPLHSGAMGLFFSVVATIWNYLFNLGFDRQMQQRYGHTNKSASQRVLHALLFEAGLVLFTVPVMAWWLGIGLLQALIMDAALIVFYLFFAYGYNYCYDRIFPVLSKQGMLEQSSQQAC